MSGIKHPISFLNWFFYRRGQKKLDAQMSWIKNPVSFLDGFFQRKCQKKSSIPKCHEWSLRYHFYMDSSMEKCQEKLDTKMSRMKPPILFLYGFFHRICQKKLDTQMSRMKPAMSFLNEFFHENVKKARYPNVMN